MNVRKVKEAILKTPRIKLKDQHITIINGKKFRVEPYDYSSDNMYFILQVEDPTFL